jgi:UDP-N-acetylmuramoyl-tripeptide--D-alanyl-D-alanine ligase
MIQDIYEAFLKSKGVCTDTRNIEKDVVFFALKGPAFNGNNFALQALQQGASFAVVDEDVAGNDHRIFKVTDVLTSLQELARLHRQHFKKPVIALTGSNGKTTTKELIASVLGTKYNVHYTQGNLNNHIGVPLTLLGIKQHHDLAVIEMGANHQGEINMLCEIALPDFGLITNVGKAHLEGFGGIEGVIKGKTEMYRHLIKNDKLIFCNKENVLLAEQCANYPKVIYYGASQNSLVYGKITSSFPYLSVSWQMQNVANVYHANTQITGDYNFENVLAAITIGHYFNMDGELIKKGIESYCPTNQRSQIVIKTTNTIIMDAYNANPTSMEAALKNLDENYEGKKIIILGEMLELGNESKKEHQHIVDQILNIGKDRVILVGQNFIHCTLHEPVLRFANSEDAKTFIQEQNFNNSIILIKGSRGSKMEKVLEAL